MTSEINVTSSTEAPTSKSKKSKKDAPAPEPATTGPSAQEILDAMSVLTNPMPAAEWEAAYNEAMATDDKLMVEALSRIGILEAAKPVEEAKNARKNNTDGKALTLRIRQETLKMYIAGEAPNMKAVVATLYNEFGELNDFTVKTVFNHAVATIRAIDSLGLKIEACSL